MAQPFSVRANGGSHLTVFRYDDSIFAPTNSLATPFGFETESGCRGHLSRAQIASVTNDALKAQLRLRGNIRFLDADGIKALIKGRIIGANERNIALSDLDGAIRGIETPVEHPSSDTMQPPPQCPQLQLPCGEDWWASEDYSNVGKIYTLPSYDQSKALKEELAQYRRYWETNDGNRTALAKATVDKRVSRVLLYLGFLGGVIKAVDEPKQLELSACLSHQAVSTYCDWCLKARKMGNANVVENLSAFISVAKYLYRGVAGAPDNNYADCEVIQRYRTHRNRLSSKFAIVHKTAADLEAEGRWLGWDTFQEAIAVLQLEFEDEDDDKSSSRLLHDLLMLRLYEASPSRSGEVRQLEYFSFDDISTLKGKRTVSKWVADERKNVITRRPLGCWQLFIGNSKTTKHHGVDEVELQEMLFPDLDRCLTQYLVEPGYRETLLATDDDADHRFVFVTSTGAPFKDAAFSKYLGGLLSRLTGRRATSNVLRSSFVTKLMESNPSEAAKTSAQSLLRHSSRMQSETYDRRLPAQKKALAQQTIATKRGRDDEAEQPPVRRAGRSRVEFSRGMLVVVPFTDTLSGEPSFWFAKILSLSDYEATLMELTLVQDNCYKADLRSTWQEPLNALHPVDAEYGEDSNVYALRTPPDEVLALLE